MDFVDVRSFIIRLQLAGDLVRSIAWLGQMWEEGLIVPGKVGEGCCPRGGVCHLGVGRSVICSVWVGIF